ncbi:MAG: hypothetical protein GY882_14210 [Actinomycetia bacterium]|nr:hypothetical protein [Actinomycetes bacterium]
MNWLDADGYVHHTRADLFDATAADAVAVFDPELFLVAPAPTAARAPIDQLVVDGRRWPIVTGEPCTAQLKPGARRRIALVEQCWDDQTVNVIIDGRRHNIAAELITITAAQAARRARH